MTTKDQPKGMGALLIDDKGRVAAHAFDFDQDGYGGFKLHEAQRMRAKRAMARKFFMSYCSTIVAEVVDEYRQTEIVEKLCRDKGWRMVIIDVNHNLKDPGQ